MVNVSRIDELGLRRRAEAKLARGDLPTKLALQDPIRMLHELQVHQIELQMQNEALGDANARLESVNVAHQALLRCAPVAVLTLTDSSRILEANPSAVKMLGLDNPATLVGKSMLTLFDHACTNALSSLLSAAIEGGIASAQELELRDIKNRLPPVVKAHAEMITQDGDAVLLLVLHDVTQLKQVRDDVAGLLLRDANGTPKLWDPFVWAEAVSRELRRLRPTLELRNLHGAAREMALAGAYITLSPEMGASCVLAIMEHGSTGAGDPG